MQPNTTAPNSAQAPAAPSWQGVHHVALLTRDIDATITFYRDVLGMKIGAILTTGTMEARHCFITPGQGSYGLHFFEYAEAQIYGYPDGLHRAPFIPGAMQHIAFALPGEEEGIALRQRLATHGIATTEIGTLGPIRNTLFFDNNGILLEATWPNDKPEK